MSLSRKIFGALTPRVDPALLPRAFEELALAGFAVYIREGRPAFVRDLGLVPMLTVAEMGGYNLSPDDISFIAPRAVFFDALSSNESVKGYEESCDGLGFDVRVQSVTEALGSPLVSLLPLDRRASSGAAPFAEYVGRREAYRVPL